VDVVSAANHSTIRCELDVEQMSGENLGASLPLHKKSMPITELPARTCHSDN
jgi:hypothetical protein